MSEENSDTKGCVGCVVVILILGAAAFYFGPDLLAWNRQRTRTNAVDDTTRKALDRVPEFLAARRLKGELLAKMRDAVDFGPWDAPESVKEPPPVGTLAGCVILWQEHGHPGPKAPPAPTSFRWHFDLEIAPVASRSDEIRTRIAAELPPAFRFAPDSFTLVHEEEDARPAFLTRVFLPKDAPPLVRALLQDRGLADPAASLSDIRFVVVRALVRTRGVGRYTDGVPAVAGAITTTFFLAPSHACLGTHKIGWSPPQTKYGGRSFDPKRAARSRFDTWLQTTHGYGAAIDPFLPEMFPVPKPKPAKPKRTRRRR